MQRRDFVKAMVAASVAAKAAFGQEAAPPKAAAQAPIAPGPVPWMEGLDQVKPLPVTPLVPDAVAETNSHFFSDRQIATLRRLSEILQPALKGYPSAAEAGTPEFLDFLIGASPAGRQQMYQSGLDRLDREAMQKFGVTFDKTSAAQADELIRPWLRTWMADHPPAESYAHFMNIAHRDIREATLNSQAWSDADVAVRRQAPAMELYWYPVDPDIRHQAPAPVRRPVAGKQHS
jgi:hypothetical protein